MAKKNSSSKVQAAFELCKGSLSQSIAPSASSPVTQKLCSLLDTFGPADVGLKAKTRDDRGHGHGVNRLNRVSRWAQPITYLDIHDCDSFTMCIFCFPTSAVIPLHNHPGMTVFSKILHGSLHVKAYDWVEPACIRENKTPGQLPVRLAKLAVDKVLTAPCATSVLYPKSGGNLHCFTAVTPCAMLDILSPPYREELGRKCTYYIDYPYTAFSTGDEAEKIKENKDDYAWLLEMDTPPDLNMREGVYAGPVVSI